MQTEAEITARQLALQLAHNIRAPSEATTDVLKRAEAYYGFLTGKTPASGDD